MWEGLWILKMPNLGGHQGFVFLFIILHLYASLHTYSLAAYLYYSRKICWQLNIYIYIYMQFCDDFHTYNFIQKDSWKTTLLLAYQSLGVVYGDLSISPLYVYKSTFADDIHHSDTNEEIFGVLSFVFWTLTLVPLFKYVFVVLRADDNGEGKQYHSHTQINNYKFPCLHNINHHLIQVALLHYIP